MLIRTLAFLTGIMTLSVQSHLLPLPLTYLLLLFSPLLLFRKWYITLVFCFCCGFFWANLIALQQINNIIPTFLEGKDILITGTISNIPENLGRRTRFEFNIDSISYREKIYNSPKKIILNWYGKTPQLLPNNKWQLLVRLKKPYSYQNPGGFDYEAWMFQKNINAKGYIRKSEKNQLLQINSSFLSFTRFRYRIKQKINTLTNSSHRAVILALLIGDKSELTTQQWETFRKTGTSHLIAISGLHIGLIAGLVFFLTRRFWGFYNTGIQFIAAPKIAAILAIISALLYSAMAGFSLPTQRALIMLCVIMASILFDVRAQSEKSLAIALLLVLLYSPFAVMNPGFWLSFIAVALIMYFSKQNNSNMHKLQSILYNWSKIQFVIGIGLMPVIILYFSESSLISPIANFIMVPIFSFLIVPLVFLAACLLFILPSISHVLFEIFDLLFALIWVFLEYLASLSFSSMHINSISLTSFAFSCIGILLTLLPRHFPAKVLALLFFIPLFFSKLDKPAYGTADITLLDVGQGLSTVIQTQHHVLVYDTGPYYSVTFDTGKSVVVPFLKSKNISTVDTMIISHGDNDHIGGLKSVVDSMKVTTIFTSVVQRVKIKVDKSNNSLNIKPCFGGLHWDWDGVEFDIIHPQKKSLLKNNNASCVLIISTKSKNNKKSILLTGDIEEPAEIKIMNNKTIDINTTILIAPHHGSKTSSTENFISKTNPDYVLYPTGYRNRYHFPAAIVSQRYQNHGVFEYNTSTSGAISFNLNPLIIKKPELYRVSERRFWHN